MRALWVLIGTIALAIGYFMIGVLEGTPPRIQTRTSTVYVGKAHTQEIDVQDAGRGIQSIRVWVETDDTEYEPLLEESYEGNFFGGATLKGARNLRVELVPKDLELADGPATLFIEARDYSWSGNEIVEQVPLVIDSKAPRISLQTGLTYVRTGGAEMAVYELDEAAERHGVQVGEEFFPGFVHPNAPSAFAVLYALPPGAGPDVRPEVVAVDRAGNERRVALTVTRIPVAIRRDTIPLSIPFMESKIGELLESPDAGADVLTNYISINRDMREENARQIKDICRTSSPDRLWTGPFEQLANSARKAGFAEARTYTFEGRTVDEQMHLGLDLASTARAEITAANDGVVVFADDLGIYGRTVIVDHGLSLFSLYGHLSEIGVEKGTAVAKGDVLGKSGVTGLSGGDHLHFAMLLGGAFIDPVEWFDGKWIDEHLEPKFSYGTEPPSELAPEAPGAAAEAGEG